MSNEVEDRAHFRSLADHRTLQLLVQNLPAAVYITNRAGEILDGNPALLQLLGVDSLEALGELRVQDLFSSQSDRNHELDELEGSGALGKYELSLRRTDGEERTVIDTCYSVFDEEAQEHLYHGVLIDISDRKELEDGLKEAVRRDPLTGCLNRRPLRSLELTPSAVSVGVVIVDLDDFKRFNDEHGHQEGDRKLVAVARYLESLVQAEDAVLRYGGDEFLVVLVGRSATAVEALASRIGSGEAPMTVCTGWAVRRTGESLESTIRRADAVLLERHRPQR